MHETLTDDAKNPTHLLISRQPTLVYDLEHYTHINNRSVSERSLEREKERNKKRPQSSPPQNGYSNAAQCMRLVHDTVNETMNCND